MHILFKYCFKNSIVPSAWLKEIIVPLPKGCLKDSSVPLNYRGITLLSCMSKIYTSIINKRISGFAETAGIFVEEQSGFRSNRSCLDSLFSLTSIIRNVRYDGKSLFTAFIDMQKAFDWLDTDLLLYKLLNYGTNGRIYNAVKQLYSQTTSTIRLNGLYTPWFDVNSGVRQGDSLSPTLFRFYVNDLIVDLNCHISGVDINGINVCSLLYADDLVVFADSEAKLQCLLDTVYNWCKKWRMKINESKSKIIHFRNVGKRATDFTFKNGPNIIETVSSYKYLGLILDEFLLYYMAVETLCSSAGRALGAGISKSRSLRNFGYKTYTKLFNSCVTPIYEYGATIWKEKKYPRCNNIFNRALRFFLSVPRSTP